MRRLRVFAVEDTTAQSCWSSTSAGKHTLEAGGREVIVVEQFRAGNDRGSSHGSSRIFRLAYEEPEWVRLAQEALPLWRELEAESRLDLLTLPGSLDSGRDPGPLCGALERCGASFELLDPPEVEERFGIRLRGPAVDGEPVPS